MNNKALKAAMVVFKFLLKATLLTLLSILIILGIYMLCLGITMKAGLDSCQAKSTARAELEKKRIELNTDTYGVNTDHLIEIEEAWGAYEIPGISKDDILILTDMYDTRILIGQASELTNPLFDLECRAFEIGNHETPVGYAEIIKDALKKGKTISRPNYSSLPTIYRIYLDDGISFFYIGSIYKIKSDSITEGGYVLIDYSENTTRYLPLEDKDGFYDWLDENVFNDTDETIEDAVPAD